MFLSALNTQQWLIITAPIAALYLVLIWTMESDGIVKKGQNALAGLFFAPLLVIIIPIFAIQILYELITKRDWPLAIITIVALVGIYGSLGWAIYAARDRPMDLTRVEAE